MPLIGGRGQRPSGPTAYMEQNESWNERQRFETRQPLFRVTNTKTSNYTAKPWEMVFVDPSSADLTVTLPAASKNRDNQICVKGAGDSGTITVNPVGSDTIDGLTSDTIWGAYGGATYISNGTDWFVLNQFNRSRLLKDQSLTVGYNDITHGLGRDLQGWHLVQQQEEVIRITASLSADFDVVNGAVDLIELDTTAGVGTSHWDGTTDYEFTAPHAGFYRVSFGSQLAEALADGQNFQTFVYLNGALAGGARGTIDQVGAAGGTASQGSKSAWQLALNDTLDLRASHSNAAPRMVRGSSTDETYLTIESDETLEDDQDNATISTTLRLWSARTRTVDLLVF